MTPIRIELTDARVEVSVEGEHVYLNIDDWREGILLQLSPEQALALSEAINTALKEFL